MIFWVILGIELLILFLTSRFIFKAIFSLSLAVFKSPNIAIIPIFILFLPGVIIHELAHFLAAELLFVKAHDLEVAPYIKNGNLQMGSVQISETDIVRRMIIGLAPILFGSFILLITLFFFVENVRLDLIFTNGAEIAKVVGVVWVAFFITNTMFSSKKDVEGFLELAGFIGFLAVVFVILSIILKINLGTPIYEFFTQEEIVKHVRQVVILFTIPLFINLLLFAVAKLTFKRVN